MFKKIKNFIKNNKSLIVISSIYAILMVSVIDWGIPNINHPFTYHMDEWHQLQAVKTTFKSLTPNTEGAAHGPLFHFLLTGLYLIPFYILKIIDPFVIKTAFSSIEMQTKIFEILRLNTIIYGLLSLFVLNQIIKKYFKINPTITLVLFTFTPVWIYLGNYFKYDIALIFWLLMAIFFILKFISKPTFKNYIVAGIFSALAVSVKISAIPLLFIYIISFFYFNKNKKILYFSVGIIAFLLTFLIVGIPDVLLGKANYGDFLSSNITDVSSVTNNFNLDYQQWWLYLLLVIMPINFGHGFFIFFTTAIIYWIRKTVWAINKKKISDFKNEIFILLSFLIFLLSLWQLKINATGNRLLVLLPFLAILSGLFFNQVIKYISPKKKFVLILLVVIVLTIQLFESLAIIYVKNQFDVREGSSIWLVENIKKDSRIGIENIPIYQLLPDIAVKEFYEKEENHKKKTNFQFEVIDVSSKQLPSIIIVTNKEFEGDYLKKSAKKDLLKRLAKEKYKIAKEFKPPSVLYFIMKNELRMNTSGLVPIPTITIYVKGS